MKEETEVEEKVAAFSTEKYKKSALKVQLYLHQKVIESFTMSSGSKIKPVTVLVGNLKLTCCWSSGKSSSSETETDYSQPSLINPAILKNQKQSYKETALKIIEKMTEKFLGVEDSRKRVKLFKGKGSGKKVNFLRIDESQLFLPHQI